MDILAGMLAYVAGIGVLFAAAAVSFSVFVAPPKEPAQTQSEPQSAHAMLARPSASKSNRPTAVAAHARRSAKESSSHADKPAPVAAGADRRTRTARNHEHNTGASTAQASRLEEERTRRWAYQQDSSFEHRFLGYAD